MDTGKNQNNAQSRIDKLLEGETPDAKKSAAGMFDQSELDRITAVMDQLGMHNRSDLIHDAVMDAIERMEPIAKDIADRNAEAAKASEEKAKAEKAAAKK